MTAPPIDLVAGALTVWNPLFEPDTILAHVNHWRSSGTGDERATWWGRIYDAPPHRMPRDELVAALEEAIQACTTTLNERGRVVVFATDFRQLHALEVDEIRYTLRAPDTGPPAAERPDYYRNRRVIAWFRMRDVRALSFEALDTLQYLREHVRVQNSRYGYDPYASFGLRYPTFVRGPSPEELFDAARANMGVDKFAELDDTVYPPRLAVARRDLEQLLGAPTWEGLDDASRLFLASARVLVNQGHTLDAQLEMTPLVMYLSNVVERELLTGVVQPVVKAVTSGQPELPACEDLKRAWRPFDLEQRMTLGSAAMMVPAMRSWEPGRQACGELVSGEAWKKWLSDLVLRRNDAAHARHVERAWVESAAGELFGERAHPSIGKPLRSIVTAKMGIRNLLVTAQH